MMSTTTTKTSKYSNVPCPASTFRSLLDPGRAQAVAFFIREPFRQNLRYPTVTNGRTGLKMKCELLLLRHFMLTASTLTSHFATLMKHIRWYFVILCGLTLMSRPSFASAKSAAQTKSATSAKSTAQFKRSPASVTITPAGAAEASLRARIT